MNTNTIVRLNNLVKILNRAFVLDVEHGCTTPEQVTDIMNKTKHPTKVEIVKSMIRKDKRQINAALNAMGTDIKISNVIKTPRQLDYVAGGVVAGLQTIARSNDRVKMVLGNML